MNRFLEKAPIIGMVTGCVSIAVGAVTLAVGGILYHHEVTSPGPNYDAGLTLGEAVMGLGGLCVLAGGACVTATAALNELRSVPK